MTQNEFNVVLEQQYRKCADVLAHKKKEYTGCLLYTSMSRCYVSNYERQPAEDYILRSVYLIVPGLLRYQWDFQMSLPSPDYNLYIPRLRLLLLRPAPLSIQPTYLQHSLGEIPYGYCSLSLVFSKSEQFCWFYVAKEKPATHLSLPDFSGFPLLPVVFLY